MCQSSFSNIVNPKLIDKHISESADCTINLNRDIADPQPLLIHPNTTEFVYPSVRHGFIDLRLGEQMELFCTGGFTINPRITSMIVSCDEGNRFSYDGSQYGFRSFVCTRNHRNIAVRSGRDCYKGASLLTIGFDVETRFIPLFNICFDENLEQTYYVQYRLTKFATSAQLANAQRPGWTQGEFFPNKNVDQLYTIARQRETISEILGPEIAASMIRSGSMFLARGHLAANSDFVFRSHQRATFHFINAAPQWQPFNNGNWLAIETASRQLATQRDTTLNVYTGTFGVSSFDDKNLVSRDLFLDISSFQIPVVKLYYKILIDESDSSGIVLIGVNNPHLTIEEIKKSYIICTDVSEKITYVRWNRNDIRRGFSYACEVDEFLKVVPHVRGIRVSKLLL